MKHIQSLVTLILAAAVLIFVIAMGVLYTQAISTQADDSCSTSVLLRASAQRVGFEGGEITCQTEYKELTGNERQVRNQLITAHSRCQAQFATALNNNILSGRQVTYCHVCGVYSREEGGEVTGIADALSDVSLSGRALSDTDSSYLEVQELTQTNQETLSLDERVAVIFFQDRTQDFSLLTLFASQEVSSATIGAVIGGSVAAVVFSGGTALLLIPTAALTGGAAGFITGHVLEGPEATVFSGIVIRPYTDELINELGCTTIQEE